MAMQNKSFILDKTKPDTNILGSLCKNVFIFPCTGSYPSDDSVEVEANIKLYIYKI